LWSISRLNFGRGERYPVIYNANRNQIRDPNRIYPGQIIIIPSKAQ
jgi:nucleoid-associated protein YgaU